MAGRFRNPLAQALGIVLQRMRDKMGTVSSSDVAASLGLAASHYRMIEAGSAILQPARAIRVVQTFETVEFVPLCQILVAIQILDAVRDSTEDMRTTVSLISESNPELAKVLEGFENLWGVIETAGTAEISHQMASAGITAELERFLMTAPVSLTAEQIDNFMTPTYRHPISGQLYDKIGNILQGVAPFYLDVVLQLTDNLRGITPRVTPQELADWERKHKNRISHIIGIVRKPEIILNVNTFDYSFLWEENFKKMFIIHRDEPVGRTKSVQSRIVTALKARYESERVKYEQQLNSFDKIIAGKLVVKSGSDNADRIDKVLFYRDIAMNNLWVYIMTNGYVVPFIDNASVDTRAANLYGSSLSYDETCHKLVDVKEVCTDAGFTV